MQAIRQIWDIESDKLIIDIPRQFRKQKVEVIILPFDRSNDQSTTIDNDNTTKPELSRAAEEFLALGGAGCWEGNLDEMRESRNGLD